MIPTEESICLLRPRLPPLHRRRVIIQKRGPRARESSFGTLGCCCWSSSAAAPTIVTHSPQHQYTTSGCLACFGSVAGQDAAAIVAAKAAKAKSTAKMHDLLEAEQQQQQEGKPADSPGPLSPFSGHSVQGLCRQRWEGSQKTFFCLQRAQRHRKENGQHPVNSTLFTIQEAGTNRKMALRATSADARDVICAYVWTMLLLLLLLALLLVVLLVLMLTLSLRTGTCCSREPAAEGRSKQLCI